MKYRINSKDYFAREEENGTMSLIVSKNNRILFFNRTGRKLLARCDEWVELEEFVASLGITAVPQDKVYDDFEKLLYELEAYGLARLTDLPVRTCTGCRMADYRDAKLVSDFLLANSDKGFSCAISVDPSFNSFAGVYTRIQNGGEQYLIDQQNEKIVGLLAVSQPNRSMGLSAAVISSAVFPEQMTREDCRRQLQTLLNYAQTVYGESCSKLRYVYMNERQNALRDELVELGFYQSALLKKEVNGERDMILYDRMIEMETMMK